MSKRHHDITPARSARKDRKLEGRRTRHEVTQTLHTLDDPEAALVVDPKADHVAHRDVRPAPGRLRHWKIKDWKRRTTQRRARNAEIEQLRRADE